MSAFTDAPALGSGWLRRSWRLLAWLFVHPSAWRNHIEQIDPTLDPDLALAELNRQHWRWPAVVELLIATSLIWPILSVLLLAALMLVGVSPEGVTFGISVGIAFGVFFMLFVALAAGLANGLAGGFASTLVLGVLGARAYDDFVYDTAGTLFEHPFTAFVDHGFGFSLGLAGCIATGVAASVAWTVSTREGRAFAVVRATEVVTARAELTPQHAASSIQLPHLARGGGVWIVALLSGSFALYVATTIADSGVPLGLLYGIVFALVYSSLISCVFGGAVWLRTRSLHRAVRTAGACVACGLILGVTGGLAYDPIGGIVTSGVPYYLAIGMAAGTATASLFVLAYVLARRRIGPWAGVVAGALAGWAASLALMAAGYQLDVEFALTILPATSLLALTLGWWRPVLWYPLVTLWNLALYIGDIWHGAGSVRLLRWNSAFWDEQQRLPLVGLSEHLRFVALGNRLEAGAALEYLAHTHQHRAVRDAQVGFDVDELERCTNLDAIATLQLAPRELDDPISNVLREFSGISRDVGIVLHHPSVHYRSLELQRVVEDLDNLLRALNVSPDRQQSRFRPAAAAWRQLIAQEVSALNEKLANRLEIANPYVVGVPLTEAEELFTGRTDLSQQLALELAKPHGVAMLLYGQRRIGKTSLLRNLPRMLPRSVVPLLVDLQGTAARASDDRSFLYNVARAISDAVERLPLLYGDVHGLRRLDREELAQDAFTRFDEWLDELEVRLTHSGNSRIALLAFDEFESLDTAFTDRRLDAARVLGLFRNMIQFRGRLRILFAGSHSLDEFERWATALVNVQVLHVGYLTDAEARHLIELPTTDFGLAFADDAVQRILELSRAHPCFVQLLCYHVVELKNLQPLDQRQRVTREDVDASVPAALNEGRMLFTDIERNQIDAVGISVLRRFARDGEQTILSRESLGACCRTADELDHALRILQQRELVESVGPGFRVQIELIRRWFI